MQATQNTKSLAGFLLINNSICDDLHILRRCLCPVVCILPDNHLTHHAGGLYDIQAGGQGPAVKAGLGFECGQCCAAEGEDADLFGAVDFEAEGGRLCSDFQAGGDGGVGDIGVLLDTGDRDGDRGTDVIDDVSAVAYARSNRFIAADRFTTSDCYNGDGLVVILIQREVEAEVVPGLHLVITRSRIGHRTFYGGKGDSVVNRIRIGAWTRIG